MHRRDIWEVEPDEATAAMALAGRLAGIVRDELGATGVNLRQNSGAAAGQDFHFRLHGVPRYGDDTVLPGCVWGEPPRRPPEGGEAERTRVAEAIRSGLARRVP